MQARQRMLQSVIAVALAAAAASPLAWTPRLEAAASVMPVWQDWTVAASEEACEFMVRFGRPGTDSAGSSAVPVQFRLACAAPLSGVALTLDGRPLAADLRVRGGSAQITSEVRRRAGSQPGKLCVNATLMFPLAGEYIYCTVIPAPPPLPRSAAGPSEGSPAPQAQAPTALADRAAPDGAMPSPVTAAPPAPAAVVPSAPRAAPAGSGVSVLDFGGGPLDPHESASGSTPGALRTGPDTSLRLPQGHVWALDAALPPLPVDNAILRALRSPSVPRGVSDALRAAGAALPAAPGTATAPTLRPSLPGIEILESTGGPSTDTGPAVAPREAPIERVEPAVPRPAPRILDVVPGRDRELAAPDPSVRHSAVRKQQAPPAYEPDRALKRAARPPEAPKMPRMLVKAGGAPDVPAGALALAGVTLMLAGVRLGRHMGHIRAEG